MKKQTGITLIALIITIIVMLILVAVTMNVFIGETGLNTTIGKAQFINEVTQFKEALQVENLALTTAKYGGSLEKTTLTLDDLSMDNKLKARYEDKLVVEKVGDNFVLKHTNNVTEQEKQWLMEIGIEALIKIEDDTITGIDFLADVRKFVEDNKNQECGYNYYEIANKIKEIYPTATILTDSGDGGLIPASAAITTSKSISNMQETLLVLDELMLEEPYKTDSEKFIEEAAEQRIRTSLGEVNVYHANTIFSKSITISNAKSKITQLINDIKNENIYMNYVVINGENIILISEDGINENYALKEETIIMTEKEASKFEYSISEADINLGQIEIGKTYKGEITGYLANENIVEFPGIIIKENGDPIFITTIKSNALATTKCVKVNAGTDIVEPLVLNRVSESLTYEGISIENLQNIIKGMGVPVGTESYEDSIEGKNQFLINYVLPIYCDSAAGGVNNCFEIVEEDNEQKLYLYATFAPNKYYETQPTFHAKPVSSSDYVECRDKVVISEGIIEIEDKILLGNTIKDLYLPKTLNKSSSSTTSLSEARIKNIRTRLTYNEMISLNNTERPAEKILGSTLSIGNINFF